MRNVNVVVQTRSEVAGLGAGEEGELKKLEQTMIDKRKIEVCVREGKVSIGQFSENHEPGGQIVLIYGTQAFWGH